MTIYTILIGMTVRSEYVMYRTCEVYLNFFLPIVVRSNTYIGKYKVVMYITVSINIILLYPRIKKKTKE